MTQMLNEVLDRTETKECYDASCKMILSQKIILGWILSDYLKEFQGVDPKVVAAEYIEGEPEVSRIDVPMIRGIRTEDTDIEEGRISGDIRFRAEVPCGSTRILNIEAQSEFHRKYPMIKRGTYYVARMISSQRGTEFTGSDYGNLKKVYVIWIFLDPPEKWKNSVTYYETAERPYIGTGTLKSEEYDLMTQILIGLGDPDEPQAVGALRLLDILFSPNIRAEEKKRILELEYGIPMTKELEKEVNDMCNFSDAVERRGLQRGIQQGIQQGIDKVNVLNARLVDDERIDDLRRAIKDDGFRQKLFEEYGLDFVKPQ